MYYTVALHCVVVKRHIQSCLKENLSRPVVLETCAGTSGLKSSFPVRIELAAARGKFLERPELGVP